MERHRRRVLFIVRVANARSGVWARVAVPFVVPHGTWCTVVLARQALARISCTAPGASTSGTATSGPRRRIEWFTGGIHARHAVARHSRIPRVLPRAGRSLHAAAVCRRCSSNSSCACAASHARNRRVGGRSAESCTVPCIVFRGRWLRR